MQSQNQIRLMVSTVAQSEHWDTLLRALQVVQEPPFRRRHIWVASLHVLKASASPGEWCIIPTMIVGNMMPLSKE